jgi:DNA modification methylase
MSEPIMMREIVDMEYAQMSEPRTFLDGRVVLHHGDCLNVLRGMADNSVDSVVTDPPYHLQSIVKRFGGKNAAPAKHGTNGAFKRASAGFMSKQWDGGDIAFQTDLWAEVMRVLKPGGHLVAMGSPRQFHRLVCAIEDAGFEIRDGIPRFYDDDCVAGPLFFAYGSGFPKSHSINKDLYGKICNCERTSQISKCDLRRMPNADVSAPRASENASPEVLFEGMQEHILYGAMSRAESTEVLPDGEKPILEGGHNSQEAEGELLWSSLRESPGMGVANGAQGPLHNGASTCNGADVRVYSDEDGSCQSRGSESVEQSSKQSDALSDERGSQTRGSWPICDRCGKPIIPEGLGTALKPAHEPICLARKPLSEPSIAANVLRWGTGALNISACRVGETVETWPPSRSYAPGQIQPGHNGSTQPTGDVPPGRWPANMLHDNSPEVLACFPETGVSSGGQTSSPFSNGGEFSNGKDTSRLRGDPGLGDSGSAARFFASFPQEDVQRIFYTSKADRDDRLGSKHPTVKPISLLRYLVRLITPRDGMVLDHFAGTGTLAEAAYYEGFRSALIEKEDEYQKDIIRRISLIVAGPDERSRESLKANGRAQSDPGPLFAIAIGDP